MRLRALAIGLSVAAGWSAAATAAPVQAVETSRTAVLTKCHNYLLSRYCHTYHHIRLPERITLGDKVPIVYGSNTKRYDFPVLSITIEGNQCTIFGEEDAPANEDVDKLVISPCRPATSP